jgi:hypothetical protein
MRGGFSVSRLDDAKGFQKVDSFDFLERRNGKSDRAAFSGATRNEDPFPRSSLVQYEVDASAKVPMGKRLAVLDRNIQRMNRRVCERLGQLQDRADSLHGEIPYVACVSTITDTNPGSNGVHVQPPV